MAIRRLEGLSALAGSYDGLILDQWGVLHDGERPYPGAIDCLERWRAKGARVVVLSNSGRRSAPNIALMTQLGFPPALYDDLIAAGEDAWRGLRHRADPFYEGLGRHCLVLGRGSFHELLAGLDLTLVDSAEAADFILLLAIENSPDSYDALLAAALRRHIPIICANPDLWRFTPEGRRPAPGALARRYESMGGAVRYHGKPHLPIYESAFSALGIADHARILAVGDSLDHDIAGAVAAGIDSLLVAGGIYAETLAWPPDAAALQPLLTAANATPTWIAPSFRW
jgi:HAD superfamily hydrolase (TIGR01459 family)